MIEPLSSRFPQALDDDDDDVAWALQTAQVQWKRGGQADAIVWLRRAADSADQLGNVWRAADLRRSADELTASLLDASAAPPSSQQARSVGGADVDALMGATDDDGLDSIDVPVEPQIDRNGPLPSYASVEDEEGEEDVETIDEVEVTAESELPEEDPEDAEEPEEIDDASVETDELDRASEPNTERDVLGLDDPDDPVTQPHLGGPRHAFGPSVHLPPDPDPEPRLGDVLLGEVRGLEDLPPEGQRALMHQAVIEPLNAEEEVSSFGLALVLRGAVNVMPTIADLSCARAVKGEIVWSRGNLEDGIALRLVAALDSTEVAIWDASVLNDAVVDCPWVVDDLKTLADRYQALAGVSMGPMGERLDDALRSMVTERCEVKRLLPGEELVAKGKPVGGMYIIAAGRIEIADGAVIDSELGPGDFLFASQVLSGGAAPHSARAGKGGALVLFAGRHVAHELLLSVPPLLEIFAG